MTKKRRKKKKREQEIPEHSSKKKHSSTSKKTNEEKEISQSDKIEEPKKAKIKKHHQEDEQATKRKKRRKKRVSTEKEKSSKEPISKVHRIMDVLIIGLLIAVSVVSILFAMKIQRAEVDSGSMEPTLKTSEKVFIIRQTDFSRFDIVVFYPPNSSEEKFVKRAIGLPGDIIEYKDDKLYINGKLYEEPYLDSNKAKFEANQSSEDTFYTEDFTLANIPGLDVDSKKIPDGMYLMLGDNRENSQDSRFIGLIPEENIIGIVWQRNN